MMCKAKSVTIQLRDGEFITYEGSDITVREDDSWIMIVVATTEGACRFVNRNKNEEAMANRGDG